MKTIEEFIKEIEGSAALQDELNAIMDKDGIEALLKKYDVSATAEEFAKALKATVEGEIADDAAEAAAGGGLRTSWGYLIKGKFSDAWSSLVE